MIISKIAVANVEEMIAALKQMTHTTDARDTYILSTKNGGAVLLELRENTLSDDSTTYDILVS